MLAPEIWSIVTSSFLYRIKPNVLNLALVILKIKVNPLLGKILKRNKGNRNSEILPYSNSILGLKGKKIRCMAKQEEV